MGQYTKRWNQAAEAARRAFHIDQTCSLWGKDPEPPRGPIKLLDLQWAWYWNYSSHELADETGAKRRIRTLDFFLAERQGLTDEVASNISGVVLDGLRYSLATDPRHQTGDPSYWRIICTPTGEKV